MIYNARVKVVLIKSHIHELTGFQPEWQQESIEFRASL
jgi:hypothetical protein